MITIYVLFGLFMLFTILTFLCLFKMVSVLKEMYDILRRQNVRLRNEMELIRDNIEKFEREKFSYVKTIANEECNRIIDLRLRDEKLRR